MVEQLVWMVPALPLIASLVIALGWLSGRLVGEKSERAVSRLALIAMALSLFLMLLLDLQAIFYGAQGQLVFGHWLESGDVTVAVSFLLDPLSLSLATLTTVIAFLTIKFSVNYMHREAGFLRFFMLLSLFSSGMLLILLAGNALFTFIGWELAGVSSYLLIAYAYDRPQATINATRVFITNRIGDVAFILAIALSFFWLGGVEWWQLNQLGLQLDTLSIDLLMLGFLVAAMAKSAQVPFAPWIGRALEGPTPSSAIFYGALMVHAGVYLMIRLAPLTALVPLLQVMLIIIGLLTAIYGYLGSLVQSDAKSTLMLSTTAQTGLMFLALGLGWSDLAAWHLGLHAAWRAYQFLHAPAMMHMVHRQVRSASPLFARWPRLHLAVQNRFWLDPLADGLLVRPTRLLAMDARDFDDQVVNPLVGSPARHQISSLLQWQGRKQKGGSQESDIGQGHGLAGRFMTQLGIILQWIEDHLVLQKSGDGLKDSLSVVGRALLMVEGLLSRPRYLLLMVMATFVVIL